MDSGLTVAKLHVDIVTVEGRRFAGEADFVVAPGSEGELGILPDCRIAPTGASLTVIQLRVP